MIWQAKVVNLKCHQSGPGDMFDKAETKQQTLHRKLSNLGIFIGIERHKTTCGKYGE